MTPKERRDRLFRKDRPFIRTIQVIDGDKYGRDIGILWVAYKKKPFEWLAKDLEQSDFGQKIDEISRINALFMAEDHNKNFKSQGPVALIAVSNDGWKYEPHVQFMPWATRRNVLRVTVSFLKYLIHRKAVGVLQVYSLRESKSLFDKCCDYGVLTKVGKILNGDPRGDEFLYSFPGAYRRSGKKHVPIDRQKEIEQRVQPII